MLPWENNVTHQRTELLVHSKWGEKLQNHACLSCPYLKLRTIISDTQALELKRDVCLVTHPSMLPATPQKAVSEKKSKTSYQFLSGTRLHVVGIWICVLQGITTLGGGGGEEGEKRRTRAQTWKSAQSVVYSHYSKLPSDKDDWTLDAGTSYTFLGRICTVKV